MHETMLAAGVWQEFAGYETPVEMFRVVFLGGLFLLFFAQGVLAFVYGCALAQGFVAEAGVPAAAAARSRKRAAPRFR